MLNHTPSPPLLPRVEWVALRQSLMVGPTSGLLKFLGLLGLISGLTCLYLWQASTISAIEQETAELRWEAVVMEIENVDLMLQLQQWYAPAYIEGEAQKLGMLPIERPIYIQLPAENHSTASPEQNRNMTAAVLWQQLTGWLQRPNQPIQAAQLP